MRTVKKPGNRAESDAVEVDGKKGAIPAHLASVLLLRGRTRLILTAALLAFYLLVGLPFQEWLGHHSNAVVIIVVFSLAWIWGRFPGGLIAIGGVLVNAYIANRTGVDSSPAISVAVDAVAIGGVAFLIGHVAGILEGALGAKERTAQAYDELEAVARDRMLTITDQVPIGLYRTTPDGKVIDGNEALGKILGLADKAELSEASVWDYYIEDSDRTEALRYSVDGSRAWTEFQLRKSDGSIIWVRDWAKAVLDEKGETAYFDGVLEDITEQRLADERFRAAFEDSPFGMTISTADGRIVRANRALAELLGRPLDDLAGMHYSAFTFDDELELTPAALEKVANGESVRYEKRFIRPDGSFIWALVSLAPVRVASDLPLFISQVMDITERRRASQALEELVRSKDELIASVSHELRTPLTVVHGLAQELNSNWVSFTVPEQKEFIGMISHQSAEVAHIVEDLLVAARADIGKLPISVGSVDLRSEVYSALASVPDLDVELEQVGSTTPVAFADPSRVRQIIRNLLANAHRYGGSQVRVRYASENGRAWLEVCDDGDGVSGTDAAKIFEPYERAHNAVGQPMSVGLGLTVSLKLARLMGGSLSYSHSDGWSVFRLELPEPGAVHVGPAR
ncbi:MAG: PAS domain-containing sensor histidine kinase [Acidimicrobiia bacterium]|nr:PAS domain-containing sensor histidine kinase [Acidimicrobiia bacterium]